MSTFTKYVSFEQINKIYKKKIISNLKLGLDQKDKQSKIQLIK